MKKPQDGNTEPQAVTTPSPQAIPVVPDHELLRAIGQGSYGEVWLARNAVGTLRAVKVVHRHRFKDDRPYEREFSGIQKYEPISRANEGLVDVLQIGRNDAAGYFYYVMELADDAAVELPQAKRLATSDSEPGAYAPKTLAVEIRRHGRLPVDECVTLGLTLTLALAYLHRRGLIHRDVKPSNIIFVNGVPKLADIGLVTELADAQSFVGTEGFIPPEGPNSPQADLYALGKVLYEAGMGKDRQEFPEPFTGGLGTDTEASALMELNAVLLKACAPAPGQRYASAEEMNADLALLHSGKSVRDKHALERRLKMTRRAALAAAAVLILAVVPYYWVFKEARVARIELAKRREVASFLEEMLSRVGPSKAKGRDTQIVREMLDETASRVGQKFNAQPEIECELRRVLARAYRDLGLYTNALAMAERALQLSQDLFGENSLYVADDLTTLGALQEDLLQHNEAERSHRKALAIRRALRGENHAEVAQSLQNLGVVCLYAGRYSEAEKFTRDGLALCDALRIPATDDNYLCAHVTLAAALERQEKFSEAEPIAAKALQLNIELRGNVDPAVVVALNTLAIIQQAQGKLPEARTNLLRAVALCERMKMDDHPHMATALDNLGAVFEMEGNLTEAETYSLRALKLKQKLFGDKSLQAASALVNLGFLLEAKQQLLQAAERFQEAITIYDALPQHEPRHLLSALDEFGTVLRNLNRLAEAEQQHSRELQIARNLPPPNQARVADALAALTLTLLTSGKVEEAATNADECLRICQKENPSGWQTDYASSLKGAVLAAQKNRQDAESLLRRGYEGLKKREKELPPGAKSCLKDVHDWVVKFFQDSNQPEKLAALEAQFTPTEVNTSPPTKQ